MAFAAALRALALASLAAAAAAVALRDGLVDNPIVTGVAPQYLDGEGWTLSNANGSIVVGASVPGDIITDLEAASVIGDPLYERNWKSAIWDEGNWSYVLTFDRSAAFPPTAGLGAVLLVFDGIKMGAHVSLNGVYLGSASDQFLRYIFEVPPAQLQARGNVLSVTFVPSSDPINKDNRFMSCSGGWCVRAERALAAIRNAEKIAPSDTPCFPRLASSSHLRKKGTGRRTRATSRRPRPARQPSRRECGSRSTSRQCPWAARPSRTSCRS